MSMLQIDSFLAPRPQIAKLHRELQPEFEHYFIYGNHYSFTEFKILFPDAEFKGLGSLGGWQWHINERGLPNLRLAYSRGGPPLLSDQHLIPTPETSSTQDHPTFVRAFGYVVLLPKRSDPALHEYMAKQGNHRISQFLNCTQKCTNEYGHQVDIKSRLKVAVYIDMRHTRDSGFNMIKDPEERANWRGGLMELKNLGAPNWYLQRIELKLVGHPVQVEPIFVMRDFKLALRVEQRQFEETTREFNKYFEEENMRIQDDIAAKTRQNELADENRRRDRLRQQLKAKERGLKRRIEEEVAKKPVSKKHRMEDENENSERVGSIASRVGARQVKRVSFVPQDPDETDEDERMSIDEVA